MHKKNLFLAIIPSLILAFLAVACGGGGGGSSPELISSNSQSQGFIEIQGIVTDRVIPNAKVTLLKNEGPQEVSLASTEADGQGRYLLRVNSESLPSTSMVTLKAEGVGNQSHVTLRNLLGSGDGLKIRSKSKSLAGKAFNITHVSTARWSLILDKGNGDLPQNEEELQTRQQQVESQVLELAAHIKLVVDHIDFLPQNDVESLLRANALKAFVIEIAGEALQEHLIAMREETLNDPHVEWFEEESDENEPAEDGGDFIPEEDDAREEEDDLDGEDSEFLDEEDDDFFAGDDDAREEEDDLNDEDSQLLDEEDNDFFSGNDDAREEEDDLDDEDSQLLDEEDDDFLAEGDENIAENDDGDFEEEGFEDDLQEDEEEVSEEEDPVVVDGDNDTSDSNPNDNGSIDEPSEDTNTQTPIVIDGVLDDRVPFSTTSSIGRFLTQSTFGPTPTELKNLKGTGVSSWMKFQFSSQPSLQMSLNLDNIETNYGPAFWKNAVGAGDQLRQRVAFALSQIMVVSNATSDTLEDTPEGMTSYYDILIRNAFGNYRTLLEEVTYSPVMGHYLTYLGSKKADPTTGQQPDENYAREVLQLFSIGLVELNQDGTPALDSTGKEVETYTNRDITGLAKVFTGFAHRYLPIDDDDDPEYLESWVDPMVIEAVDHSNAEKSFLGTTIPANTDGTTSVSLALDAIFNHPNVGPFIGRQLIQRLVTSNPTPAYVRRVSQAFEVGSIQLPDGSVVGQGKRGDLMAVTAAILLDPEARATPTSEKAGKVREPILRFTAWARAFQVSPVNPQYVLDLFDTSEPTSLGQHPLKSPSVFNFYRPGYVAPGSNSAASGMVAPELQLVNASSIPNVVNFLELFVVNEHNHQDILLEAQELEKELGRTLSLEQLKSFVPNYQEELRLATQPSGLIDHLNQLLVFGTMTPETKASMAKVLSTIDGTDAETLQYKVHLAILMVMSSPDFIVQL